ncbi:3-oxoadipate enol-lactonase [Modicisalibacter muralis]|uniref:3-oxoadipate enol-lactonase n=1 Tax=Modicisalibacter muralis TaxID=119000 RepID=A0A1G9GQT0_9GAMM|nr:alpha/beta fold hydrolase [Halomonas muralis]SDL03039.1 3-oxoadipate enol-lactonase [Halomonas muralis]
MSEGNVAMDLTHAQHSPDGTRYWRQGQGAPLVLVHGVGLDARMWRAQVDALAREHEVIAYDMLGHGESPLPAAAAGLDDYADQLATLLDHLALERVAVVGFSMGGLVARAFALRHPQRLTAMVVLSSVFRRDADQRAGVRQRLVQARDQGPAANVDEALERWFSPAFRRDHPERVAAIHATVTNNHPEGYYRSYALFGTQDDFAVDRLATIRVPVLVATGELDPGSTPQMTRALADCLPHAEAEILPGQRHMVPVEAPEAVNALLRRFLAGVDSQDAPKEVSR